MTTDMIRKQIYISQRQEQLLKRLAQALQISEAEFIRQAIDRQLSGETSLPAAPHRQTSAFEEFMKLARTPRGLQGEPVRWKRAELYEERENRWPRRIAEGDDHDQRPD
jgi:hypothetical protein